MTALRRAALALTLAAASVAAATSAPPATAAGAPVLTVTGSRTGSGTVVLERDSRVAVALGEPRSMQVRVDGGGRLVALVLERVGPGEQPVLGVFRANPCSTRGCRPEQPEYGTEMITGSLSGEEVALPAGTYRVALVTDGAPVTVRLALDGLARPRLLRPTGPAAGGVVDVPLRRVGAPFHLAASGGRTHRFARPAWLLTSVTSRTVVGAQQLQGDCVVLGEAPPQDAYAPGCPTADPGDDRFAPVGSTGLVPHDASSYELGSAALTGLLPAGRPVSAGHWLTSAVPLRSTTATHLTVELPG